MIPLLLVAPLMAAAEEDDFRSRIDQARFFIRRQWYEDALTELEAAVATDDGRVDPEAWYMLATVRFELTDVEGARAAAARAHSFSRDEGQLAQASGLSAFLEEHFGLIEVRAPYSGLTGRLDVQLESMLFDPHLAEYLNRLERRHRGRTTFPVRLALPAGTYRINGSQVVVGAGTEQAVDLGAGQIQSGHLAVLQLAQAEASAGMSVWFGEAVEHLLPAIEVQLAVSQPVGPLVAGLMVDWTPRSYLVTGLGHTRSPAGVGMGARLGFEIPGLDPVIVRPSLGWRYLYLPGLPVDCARAEGAFRCDGSAEDLRLYVVGRAHVPLAELAVDYADRRRGSGFGVGFKVVGERALGHLPTTGEALLENSGERVRYTVEDEVRSWDAYGLRILANLTLSF